MSDHWGYSESHMKILATKLMVCLLGHHNVAVYNTGICGDGRIFLYTTKCQHPQGPVKPENRDLVCYTQKSMVQKRQDWDIGWHKIINL